ncbi:MAG: hypothetical protein Q9195_009272 [Heterodermia aff. obscurata]
MASKEDPFGERTLGVITKCDVTQHPDLVVRLARNDRDGDIYFQHGWFVVRNRTPGEASDGIDSSERQLREEKLFNSVPWNTLPSSRRGVQALKKHLADLLYNRMQEAFPKMLADIQDRIKSTSTALGLLGSDRSSIEQKRTYLTKIAQRFNAIALGVLRGRYDMIEGDQLKLRKHVRDANDGFMRELKSSGHRVPFMTIPKLQLLEGKNSIGAQGTSLPTGSSFFSPPQNSGQATAGIGLGFGKSGPINVGSVPGTRGTAFQPQINLFHDEAPSVHYQNISLMPPFRNFSSEELRLKDYVQDESTSNNSGNVFGAPWNPAPATSNSAATTSAKGTSAPGFSQYASNNQASSSPFAQILKDSNPNTVGFGASVLGNSGVGFGSTTDGGPTTNSFGSTLSEKPAGGLFGSAPGFGSAANNKSTTSIFASSSNDKPASGLFGSAATDAFGSSPSEKPAGGLFGSAPNNKSTTNLFASSSNDKPAGGLFGSAATNAFGSSTSDKPAGGLFGSAPNNRSTTGIFGSSSSDKPAASLFKSSPDTKPTPSLFGPTPGQKPTTPTNPANGPTPGSRDTDPQDAEIYRWIRTEIQSNRGTELQGTLNAEILPTLFHQQAGKWGDIAEKHFASVVKFSLSVLNGILDNIECDRITRKRIRPLIYDASDAREEENLDSLLERFNNIRSRHLQTSNTSFERKVAQARYQRFQAALDRYRVLQQERNLFAAGNAQAPTPADANLQFVVDMRDTAQLFSELHMSNSRNLENEIHDTLKAYYEIARDDYIEYVTQHIVENFINSENGPVLMFSPLYVAGLSDEQIEDLAMEDEGVVKDRIEKEAALKRLKSAERIALRYA